MSRMTIFITWRDNLNLGIPEIDDQHKALAGMLNDIASMLHGNNGSDQIQAEVEATATAQHSGSAHAGLVEQDPVLMLLEKLVRHTREHFACEEALMQASGYPDLNTHRREHVMLLAELKQFLTSVEEGGLELTMESLSALKHWLIAHIVESDQDYADFYFHPSIPENRDA